MLYVGLFVVIMGLIGSVMQVFILMTVSYYRKTPCTFYFIIAAVHECGQFITAFGPLVIAAYLDIDITRISVVWCKLRFFFLASFCAIPLTCACLATIDQYLITSHHVWYRQWSNIKTAHRASLAIVIIWWLHGTLWLYYQDMSPTTGVCIYRSISPYGIYSAYAMITVNIQKNADRKVKEALAANITYLFGALAYGGRFYLFMFASPRFRRMVKNRILWWRRSARTVPLAR
ncbi:unnamed protein product [Rotaria sp. Silwood1]|nr:unnamed protein product [Rotaria sp. Silwood1]CAF4974093.1 unnamed protein product [Rotaria sp. Silwood1]